MYDVGQSLKPWGHTFANIVPVQGTRIVGEKVHPIGLAPAVGAPQLTYRGGPLIAQIKVFALYWGSAWNPRQPGGSSAVTRQALDAFLSDLVGGAYMNMLAEYSTNGYTIQPGRLLGSAIIGPDPAPQIADSDIRSQIQQRLADGSIPPWDANTLYAVFLPSGTTISQGGANSCQQFCGYHDAILDANGNAIAYYAALPYPDCAGCASAAAGTTLAPFDALTAVTSHEVAEAITDPVPGSGWYDDTNGEIGDICAWQLATQDTYTVQQEWSNAANSCVGPNG